MAQTQTISPKKNSIESLSAEIDLFKNQQEQAKNCLNPIYDTAQIMIDAIKAGNKVFFCGNGGSAGDSQHLSAELVGRFKANRKALPSISLTVDTSALTAIGNDYGFEFVFSRQLEALGKPGDVLLTFSTSGNSKNVIEAAKTAKQLNMKTVLFCGQHAGDMHQSDNIDTFICAPSKHTDQIQQMHMLLGHMLCGLVEKAFVAL